MNIYKDFYKGEGIDSYDNSGFDATSNLDTHTSLGVASTNPALVLDNSTITEPCYQAQDESGNLYFFSSTSGKIWLRDYATGTVTLVRTNSYGSHSNAKFFDKAIIYVAGDIIGRYEILTDTWTDSFALLQNHAEYHPMEEVNAILHIGDGNDIASINAETSFNQSALDLPLNYITTALLNDNSYLLNGSSVGSTVVKSRIFYWDTYSSSWTIEDETGQVNFFIKVDNYVFAQIGSNGWIYSWDGNKAAKWKPVRNVETSVSVQATTQVGDKTLFAIGDNIYSLHQPAPGMGFGIVHEYTADSTIQSIHSVGDEIFVSTQTGVYKKDQYNKATGSITTPIYEGSFDSIEVPYETLNGGSLSLETSVNGGSFVTESGFVNDTTNSRYVLIGGVTASGSINYGQARITINPVSDKSPKVKGIIISGHTDV